MLLHRIFWNFFQETRIALPTETKILYNHKTPLPNQKTSQKTTPMQKTGPESKLIRKHLITHKKRDTLPQLGETTSDSGCKQKSKKRTHTVQCPVTFPIAAKGTHCTCRAPASRPSKTPRV